MTRTYQRKLLADGLPNPLFRPDVRARSGRAARTITCSGAKQTKWDRGEFVAWDGEGIGRGRHHAYVLFANSLGDATQSRRGISSGDALDFLCDGMARAPHAIHVGFAISYDTNMMLADVPKRLLRKLWNIETVEWKVKATGVTYRLSWRPRKFFRVKRTARDGSTSGGTWWDVWPFFQSSFVGALTKYGVVAPEIITALTTMKAKRARFRSRDLVAIGEYNTSELAALVKLMRALWVSLRSAGMQLTRWDGPGALAAFLLDKHEYKTRTAAPTPDAALNAFQFAYYGGRIECVQYGHVPKDRTTKKKKPRVKIHHYDVNSAYPAAMRTLPCRALTCGEWVRLEGDAYRRGRWWELHPFAVHHVEWSFAPAVLYPFPWRSHRGSVYFPPRGLGWVWTPELLAARAYDRSGARVIESWYWKGFPCHHGPAPCAWIDDAYEERQKAKRQGDAAEHALKLALNSLYGKTAQRVGAQWDKAKMAWRLPPYHDLAGAGWITSSVRALLYRAAMQHPLDVVMLATDAIYSTRPLTLPGIASNEKTLGEWTYTPHTGCTVVQSGVYFTDQMDGAQALYSRGFDAASVNRPEILRAWRKRAPHLAAFHERFIGLGRALAGPKSWEKWRTWVKEPRDLTLHPWTTKRTPVLGVGRNRPADPSRGLIATRATDTARFWCDPLSPYGKMTTPSAVPWRALPGIDTRDIDPVQRAEDESEDAGL